jgi:hypothetical protein
MTGDTIVEKEPPYDAALITHSNYAYVYYRMLTGDMVGQELCTRIERMEDEWYGANDTHPFIRGQSDANSGEDHG